MKPALRNCNVWGRVRGYEGPAVGLQLGAHLPEGNFFGTHMMEDGGSRGVCVAGVIAGGISVFRLRGTRKRAPSRLTCCELVHECVDKSVDGMVCVGPFYSSLSGYGGHVGEITMRSNGG